MGGVVVALVSILALMWSSSASDLRHARTELGDLERQSVELHRELSSTIDAEVDLQDRLEELQADLEAAKDAGEDREEELDAREEALDARTTALDQRETDLDAREAEIDVLEGESDDTFVDDNGTGTGTDDSVTGNDFDRAWLLSKAGDAIEDIASVDERLGDGIAVSSALSLLSDSFERMQEAGVPPGLDAATYLARLETLQTFAADAADLYDVDPTEATAKYAVLRKETGVLFDQINTALGTQLSLP